MGLAKFPPGFSEGDASTRRGDASRAHVSSEGWLCAIGSDSAGRLQRLVELPDRRDEKE